jgi:hypothetical protein
MHLYQLQRYSGIKSKHRCPQCQHKKTFKLYINTQTNLPLNDNVGMCDRLDKCGYHYTPKKYFAASGLPVERSVLRVDSNKLTTHNPQPSTSYIPYQTFTASLSRYEQNNLVEHLRLLFDDEKIKTLIATYLIGTSKHWHGATVFWQVDINGQVRAGKIMLYNVTNAKRVKLPFNHITWVHTVLNLRGNELLPVTRYGLPVANQKGTTQNTQPTTHFQLNQCFFGEHLLYDTTKPVAIVESEKTALIASGFMPAYTWLATGGLNNLTPQKCNILQGRQVYLYPDLNAYNAWAAKVAELGLIANFILFPGLEQIATEQYRRDGLDIADYLMGLWPL